MRRRDFLQRTAAGSGWLLTYNSLRKGQRLLAVEASPAAGLSRVEARYYDRLPDREIKCRLCPRFVSLEIKSGVSAAFARIRTANIIRWFMGR